MLPVARFIQVTALLGVCTWLAQGLALSGAQAQIFTYLVTKTSDTADGACDEDCSLREAITVSNTISGPKNVLLGPGVFTLSRPGPDEDDGLTGDLDITQSMTITGVGTAETIIDAAAIDRVIHVIGDGTVLVTLRHLTLRGGLARGGFPGGGGGLLSEGAKVALDHVRVEANRVESTDYYAGGGGVATYQGEMVIDHSTVTGNEYRGPLLGGGGGVFALFSPTTVRSSTVSGNTSYGRGGGLMNLGYPSPLSIDSSTITGNAAIGDGGPTKVAGGGVFTDDALTSIRYSTLSDNFSSDYAGGVTHDGTRVELFATILAGNEVPPGGAGPDCLQGPFGEPSVVSLGFNLVGDSSDCATFRPGQPTDLVGDAAEPIDPRLGALADNGGPTQTLALLADSPALDHVPTDAGCPDFDQRDVARPYGAACDVGAYELVPTRAAGTVVDARGVGIPSVVMTATGPAGSFQEVTSADGSFVFAELPPGSYTLTPQRTGFTFSPDRTVTVPPSANALAFKGYDRPPIVLVAGFSSEYGTAFPPVPSDLAAAGYYVREADLVNLADGYVPIMEENVAPLMSAIDTAKHETGQSQVILLAHSMGGLVSRAYVEGPFYPPRRDVVQLFTFGTPHRGVSPFWSDIVPFLATSLTAGTINNLTACTVMPGFCQMSKSSMVAFNGAYQRRPGIDYHAIGGDTPMWTKKKIYIPFPVRIPVPERTWHNALGWALSALVPGPDDGFIETPSSLGLTGPYVDVLRTQEVHDPVFGHRAYFSYDGAASQQSYARCMKTVLIDKSTRTCGARQVTPPLVVAERASLAEANDEDGLPVQDDLTPMLWAPLAPGSSLGRDVSIATPAVSFVALWDRGPQDFWLVDPDGTVVAPSSADDELVQYEEDEHGASYVLADAAVGIWRLVVEARPDSPAAFAGTFAAFQSPLQLELLLPQAERPWYPSQSLLTLRARLSAPVASATMEAQVQLVDGSSTLLELAAQPDGSYAGDYTVGAAAGLARVLLSARGTLPSGVSFELGASEEFVIMADDPVLTGDFATELVEGGTGSAPYAALRVRIGVAANAPRGLLVSGDLRNEEGQVIAHATELVELAAGAGTVALTFSGEDLFRSAVVGPLTLTHLQIVERSSIPPVPAVDLDDVYGIAPVDYRAFAPSRGAPWIEAGGPYSVAEGGLAQLTARAVDPEGDPLTIDWDLDGDGAFEAAGPLTSFDAAALDGPSLLPVTAKASDGAHYTRAFSTVDVLNVAPAVASIAALTGRVGAALSLPQVAFTDPGRRDTHEAQVDWGDGTPLETLHVMQDVGGGSVTGAHVYTVQGSYDGELCVHDKDGDVGCRTFEVTVMSGLDCSRARPRRDSLWPPSGLLVPITLEGLTHASGPVEVNVQSIRQDEPVYGKHAGLTAPDARGVGTHVAWLRAERDGQGDGRAYHVSFAALAADGERCQGQVVVTVPKRPKVSAVDGGPLHDSTVDTPKSFWSWLLGWLPW